MDIVMKNSQYLPALVGLCSPRLLLKLGDPGSILARVQTSTQVFKIIHPFDNYVT